MRKTYKIVGIILTMALLFTSISVQATEGTDAQNTEEQYSVEEPKEDGVLTGQEEPENKEKVKEIYNDSLDKSEKEKPVISEEKSYDAEKAGMENSWRYQEGKLIQQRTRYTQYTTWPKISEAVSYGIDVSHHNGVIDWAKAKKAGVEYAIIRCGYGMNQTNQDDQQWKNNVNGCIKNNIPFGVYIYSYADTTERAKSEAEHVLRLIKGYNFDYPIYYDLEESDIRKKLSKKQIADVATTFCNTIENAGYEVGIYANTDWFTNYLTDTRFNQWEKWVAQYNVQCEYKGKYSMWQCSSQGKVDGIKGNVDLNVDYTDRGEIRLVVKDGNTYCYKGDQKLYGEQKVKNEWYYFDKTTGIMITGWYDLPGKRVYYEENGKMVHGEKRIDSQWYMFDKVTGAMKTGFYKHPNKTVYYNNAGRMQYGEQKIGGKTYYFDTVTGAMKTGWFTYPNKKVYFGADGSMCYGEKKVSNEWYMFDKTTGAMKTGWYDFPEKRVYYEENGKMVHGEKRINSQWYMFDKVTGAMKTGFYKHPNKTVYYNNAGRMQYGEQKIGGKTYYFDTVTGAMKTGWFTYPNKKVYFGADGSMCYGEKKISNEWYMFDKVTGAMKTGWYDLLGKRVYYEENGKMVHGEKKINSRWYMFDKVTGAMKTGFYKHPNKTVYYNSKGQMLYGKQTINGKIYVFNNVTGALIR